jgi:hypothetical protein
MLSGFYARAMTISRKLSSIAAVVLLAGLTLSACGDKDDSGDKSDAGSSGGGKTVELTQANFSQVLADSQAKAKSAHITMTLGMGGQTIKAQGDVEVGSTPADGAMAMTMDMGSSMKLDMRLVDQVFYMNMGQMTEGKYVKLDLTDDSSPIAKQYGQIMDQMDPAKQLEQFKDALKSFEKKGEPQTIDGVKAQPYVVTVDTTKIKAFKDLPAASASQIPDTIVYTMYVGPDDLPRRMEFELAGAKSTMDYTKWGEPVDIKAPAAGDISDKDLSQLGGTPTPGA